MSRFNHVVYVGFLLRDVGVSKFFAVFSYEFGTFLSWVFGGCDFFPEDYVGGSFCAHNCDFCCWPSVVDVAAGVFASHDDVGSAICFAGYQRDLRHGSLNVGVEQFGAVSDDAAVFLVNAWKEARYIYECDDGDVEAVAEADKTSGFSG